MGGLFKTPEPPKVQPPVRMPDPEDPQKRELTRQRIGNTKRSGRVSTFLSDFLTNRTKLGGGGQ